MIVLLLALAAFVVLKKTATAAPTSRQPTPDEMAAALMAKSQIPVLAAGIDYVVTAAGTGNQGIRQVTGELKPEPGDVLEYYDDNGQANGIKRTLTPANIAASWNAASEGDYLWRGSNAYRIGPGKKPYGA